MQNKKGNRPSNLKLVFLKIVPNKISNAIIHQSRQDYRNRIAGTTISNIQKYQNSNSIALLSSLIQDERIDTTIKQPDQDEQIYLQIQQKPQTVLCNKINTRNLSSLIKSDDKGSSKILRSKTEGIDKLLGQNKIMPINKLKHGIKNIQFSTKNKKDLGKDFKIFLQNKEDTQVLEKTNNRSTVFSTYIRFHKNKKYKSGYNVKMREQYFTRRKQNVQKEICLSHYQTRKDLSEFKSIEDDGNYGVFYKQLKRGFPHMRQKFQWSKLNENQRKYILN